MGREAHAACTSDKMTFESRTSRNVGSMHCYFRDEQPLAAAPLPKHTINNNTLYVICNRDEDEDEAGPVRMYRLCEATYLATSTLLPLSHFTPPVKDEACPAQQQPCSHRERCHESLCDPDSSTRTATPPWLDPTSQAQHDPSAADGTCTHTRRRNRKKVYQKHTEYYWYYATVPTDLPNDLSEYPGGPVDQIGKMSGNSRVDAPASMHGVDVEQYPANLVSTITWLLSISTFAADRQPHPEFFTFNHNNALKLGLIVHKLLFYTTLVLMSPARPSSRRNSSGGFKPYTRGVTPIMVSPKPEVLQDAKSADNVERPGFPTYAQYKQVEATYLQSLTPRRQGKALISQALFDRIWDVLHEPDGHGETAQFRFWARKMFTVSKTHRVTLGVVDNGDDTPQEVLLHDNLLVAIQEQLYDLLCYCHGSTGHGGRDKTCALIRKHYTWVPKDLVSNFIKSCPTCIMKKCGNFDTTGIVNPLAEPKSEEANLPAMRDFLQNMYGADGTAPASSSSSSSSGAIPWPPAGGPRDNPIPPSMLGEDELEAAYREAILRARAVKSLSGVGGPTARGLHSLPMSREVSLYKGLPNGWQFRHSDYASAHAEFMKTKDMPVVEGPGQPANGQRPRVPSIVPLWGPDHFPHPEFEGLEGPDIGDSQNLPALEPNPQTEHGQRDEGHSPGLSLQYLLMTSQKEEKDRVYMPQIDPLLMQYPGDGSSSTQEQAETKESESSSNLASSKNYSSSSSIKRAAAPLHLNLEFPTEKTFQALLAYRDSLGEGNMTPDSPLTSWHHGNPSPASSESSCSSQLSAFPMSSAISATTTPASSALTTPVNECGAEGSSNIVKGKKRQVLPASGQDEEELSGGIQAACGL
ncbi:hypothetical protein BDZ97DRAFT_1755059 [Flammula alnicola]|nr:hypothetical protein BDZ97DRAFT_1755059 [Flammula alnicola]